MVNKTRTVARQSMIAHHHNIAAVHQSARHSRRRSTFICVSTVVIFCVYALAVIHSLRRVSSTQHNKHPPHHQ